MRIKFILSLFLLSLYSCKPQEKAPSEVLTINPNEVQLSPIQHDSLSKVQMANIQRIQSVFAAVNPSSFEKTVDNFRRDAHPDQEIALWLRMAAAYEKYVSSQNKEITQPKKQEAYKLILLRSMMPDEEAVKSAELSLLSQEEITNILSCYLQVPTPVTIIKK